MRRMLLILGAIMLICLPSCHHKDLMYEEPLAQEVDVVFDWRKAPDANPESMVLYLYNTATGERLRYIFAGRDGGTIRLPYGVYNALCLNADNEDWALFNNTEDIESFETFTHDMEDMGLTRFAYLPTPAGKQPQRSVSSPGKLVTSRSDGFELKVTDVKKTLVMYPEDVICHYTVEITDVVNGNQLGSSSVDASLSDLSEGYMNGKGVPSEEKVTVPFSMVFSESNTVLRGEFQTFGEPSRDDKENTLSIYFYMKDGTRKFYTFNVTDQVISAPDPKNVFIRIKGLKIPEESVGLGTLIPDVEIWQTENIELKM